MWTETKRNTNGIRSNRIRERRKREESEIIRITRLISSDIISFTRKRRRRRRSRLF